MNGEKSRSNFMTSDTPHWNTKRNPKVNIKEICEKFEKLSSSTENSDNSELSPFAPVRRKKILNVKVVKNGFDESTSKDEYADCKNNSSIKEKTKIFESPMQLSMSSKNIQKTNTSNPKIKVLQNNKIMHENLSFQSPPQKPPRSLVTPTGKVCVGNVEVSRKCSLPESQLVSEIFSKFPSEVKAKNFSPSQETKYGEINKKSSRGNNTPELTINPLRLNSRNSKMQGNSQSFLDCFRNIQQKVSGIFVDLTPTTVSPPKHYGTLKKSLSDEHIYAEVSPVKPNGTKSEDKPMESLHYMCTPIIPPVSSKEAKTDEKNIASRQSVRNLIYGSFAGLRSQPKDNLDCNTSNAGATESNEADISMKAIQARIIYVKSVRKQISSSSMCLAPKLYEALFVINIVENQPQVTYFFPMKIADEFKVPLLPHICFPSSQLREKIAGYHSEIFHFTLTDKEETIFGYCLRIQGWPEKKYVNESFCFEIPVAICILSSFSAPVFYKKLLFEIEKHLNLPRNKCFKYIRSLQKLGVPNAGASLSIPDHSENNDEEARTVISRPLDSHFVGLEMTRALQLLDVDILIKCVASLFLERRILFLSKSTSNLSECCKAISSLLYPFEWPHALVPVLPACLTVQCCSDQPYIYGILSSNCDSVLELLLEHELLIIDVDKGLILKSCHDEDTILPKKVQRAVLSALNLAKNMTDPTEMLRDIMISEAFVHMSVEMIGHYENHFIEVNGSTTFQKESFLKHAFSYNIRSFLQWFSETQMFDTFIEECLWNMKYRDICQTNLRTFFEKRVDEYKWELNYGGDKISRLIGKTVRNFGEKLRGLKK